MIDDYIPPLGPVLGLVARVPSMRSVQGAVKVSGSLPGALCIYEKMGLRPGSDSGIDDSVDEELPADINSTVSYCKILSGALNVAALATEAFPAIPGTSLVCRGVKSAFDILANGTVMTHYIELAADVPQNAKNGLTANMLWQLTKFTFHTAHATVSFQRCLEAAKTCSQKSPVLECTGRALSKAAIGVAAISAVELGWKHRAKIQSLANRLCFTPHPSKATMANASEFSSPHSRGTEPSS